MKRHKILSLLIVLLFGSTVFAGTKNAELVQQAKQTQEQKEKKETVKYDFSLFKFLSPLKEEKNDSLKQPNKFDEKVDLYVRPREEWVQKPLSVLRFS